jgi:hypothetical protein
MSPDIMDAVIREDDDGSGSGGGIGSGSAGVSVGVATYGRSAVPPPPSRDPSRTASDVTSPTMPLRSLDGSRPPLSTASVAPADSARSASASKFSLAGIGNALQAAFVHTATPSATK